MYHEFVFRHSTQVCQLMFTYNSCAKDTEKTAKTKQIKQYVHNRVKVEIFEGKRVMQIYLVVESSVDLRIVC